MVSEVGSHCNNNRQLALVGFFALPYYYKNVSTMPTDPSLLDSVSYETLWPEGIEVAGDSAEVRRRILHVASVVLRRKTSLDAFSLWLDGCTVSQIADAQNRATEAVHRTLWGVPNRGLLGAVAQVKDALEKDEVFLAMAKKETAPDVLGRQALATWFVGVPHDRFVEMAALLAFSAVADAEGSLTVGDAYAAMAPPIVTHALPRLRWGGWIQTDGIRIKILKTPEATNA